MKKRQISDLLKKISIIMTVTVFCLMGFGFTNSCHADEEIEEWEESGTILLDKVIYSRNNFFGFPGELCFLLPLSGTRQPSSSTL